MWLPVDDPIAKALGYFVDATKVERIKKGDTDGKDQFCRSC